MSFVDEVPTPQWVMAHDTVSQVDHAKLCFLIRLAALYHNERGSLGQLSIDIGLSEPALSMACKRGSITGEIAVAIETKIGRALFPRELFRPDLFTLPEA